MTGSRPPSFESYCGSVAPCLAIPVDPDGYAGNDVSGAFAGPRFRGSFLNRRHSHGGSKVRTTSLLSSSSEPLAEDLENSTSGRSYSSFCWWQAWRLHRV